MLDLYVNLFIPVRKLIHKERDGKRIRKTYDQARSPYQRIMEMGLLDATRETELIMLRQSTNPLQLHRQLEQWLARGPDPARAFEMTVTL